MKVSDVLHSVGRKGQGALAGSKRILTVGKSSKGFGAFKQAAKPIDIGLTGLGGFAGEIRSLLEQQSATVFPPVRLTAVCEPDLDAHAEAAAKLRARGITVVREWSELLALPIEAVWLPLPIRLHRPFTEQALLAGKPVLCEKPAAGSVQDVDAMIASRDEAKLPVAIGFQDIYKPSTVIMKRALMDGSLGKVRSAAVTGYWPRSSVYYARSTWAGRQMQDGVWIMDSPASNALAHFLNLALFLLGDEEKSADLAQVEAELYRANTIENYDTCALRYRTSKDVPLVVCYTHACAARQEARLVIQCEHGSIDYTAWNQVVIKTKQGTNIVPLPNVPNSDMVQRFAHLLRGVPDERAVATLEVARAHVVAVNGASEASPVFDIGADYIDAIPQSDGAHQQAIRGIAKLFDHCAENLVLPHETGLAPWTLPAGSLDLTGYKFFNGPK